MIKHSDINKKELFLKIKNKEITLGGNRRLKIYGTLQCKSGKRMKIQNRMFFKTEKEAKENDFRPCGHCMTDKYKLWKAQQN
ncbi:MULTISPECIES: Ada metal-binding domain-containing protein [unclassified Tenacibaculum]|uniref:Ada metal-binding domain-containing protein n=1 Tax=unclassified Tenacibaculum TaxID=2635139 RepID=UPI001F1EC985|nr:MULTISPECIES: Ada metal-binding domain-containing protein [unclassified Tenacibaculum]MCF2876521.1 metal-binding protein [Tenacibaculum sp. Cn5-1]MCF2936572.1 metal-binding protein [Tenacibaculum sp. Cn5-34]MCG7511835.1 metal-binding protein [Tenacibaculum sp. Cn5-46]